MNRHARFALCACCFAGFALLTGCNANKADTASTNAAVTAKGTCSAEAACAEGKTCSKASSCCNASTECAEKKN